jgi:V-type H+-transporting ATPase subunit a
MYGTDPSWYLATNELTYLNSLKMKISVIFGVAQMCLGIFLKALNALYFRKMLDFFHEFVPQMILMVCLFGWMDFLIIMKWLTNWEGRTDRAPGIVGIMISMFLKGGSIDETTTDAIVDSVSVQQDLSLLLLFISLVTIPWMLLVKPLIILK